VPGVSIPPFLSLPSGVTAGPVPTRSGSVASLSAEPGSQPVRGSVLLVPGFTGSKEDFIAVLTPLAARGLRAVAIDLPGQFESPGDDDPSLAGFAAAVREVASSLDRPLALLGHSFGGLVVREAVLSDPLGADGLVLVASGPASLPPAQQEVLRRFTEVLNQQGLDAVWQAKRSLDAARGAAPVAPDIDAFLTRRFLGNDPRSLVAMMHMLCTAQDQTGTLAAVAPPVVVVVGGRDDVWPLDQQRAMAEQLGAALVELPESGHSPVVDDPQAVAAAVSSLFDGR
jgi:pimeloyl-ACP methyl ester carboxylesterase